MGRAMGRCCLRRQRRRRQREVEEILMTPEEAAESAKACAQKWRLELAALPVPKQVPMAADMSAYGDWRLPPGHENWVQDRIKAMREKPFPEVFCPPLPRVQLDQVKIAASRFSARPADGEIFKPEYPELVERAKAFLAPPPECEGAVGYDQRYYATPYLIRCMDRRRPPPSPLVSRGVSFLDARRCAQLVVDDRKLQSAKARKKARTKTRRRLSKLRPIATRRKWQRANKRLKRRSKPSELQTESESEPDLEEQVLSELEDLYLDSDCSSDTSTSSLQEFLRLEESLQ